MRYKLAEDAKPQVWLLLVATIITIALWFIPFADYLVYPIRLFVTFIHEGSHALTTVLTGNSVQSLTVSPDGSGVVWSTSSGLSQFLISSAGYLGTTAFGVLLLFLIRRVVSANKVLMACSIFVGVMTLLFGFLAPIWHWSDTVSFGSVAFTVFSGAILTAGLFGLGKFASMKVANFAVAFLAVQCLLNAFSDLKTLFFINAPLIGTHQHSDAANMAAATNNLIPGFVWVLIWIGISILMISVGLRVYAVSKNKAQQDLPFED